MGDATSMREMCVLRYVLRRLSASQPQETFACFEDGETWTYEQTHARTRRLAAALQSLGVEQGDHVLMWLPNGRAALETFLAVNYIGAVYAPINTAYRGALLEHVVENSDARIMVAHGDLVSRLGEIDTARLATVIVAGGDADAPTGVEIFGYDDLIAAAAEPTDPERAIEPWDTQSIIYTSGTTGPSKGVLSSYLHAYSAIGPDAWYCVREDDRFMVNLPMFHIGGSFIVNSMLCRGASIAMMDGFRTETFWRTARRTESTIVFLLGVMASFLLKQPESDEDRRHTLERAFVVPFTADARTFSERFGVEVYALFNMTEIATPLISEPGPTESGYCGRARAGYELRLVDEHDIPVETGRVGELILRADEPWTLNHGYYKNPAATAEAWRNGWFHTGDAFRSDADGRFFFVDRIKDSIRRRGENISSFEVEAQVNAHPDVLECAAIPIASEFGEDDVMVVLAPKAGRDIDAPALLEFLAERMAHFMTPRFFRIVDALPMTPTGKIRKARLKDEGVTSDTWDREAAGHRIKAERLA